MLAPEGSALFGGGVSYLRRSIEAQSWPVGSLRAPSASVAAAVRRWWGAWERLA